MSDAIGLRSSELVPLSRESDAGLDTWLREHAQVIEREYEARRRES